ncbi:MAG: hypothetical protein H0V18_03380 [Pyrinomonadaceae bacterium]|nr:hypothetical protein [Pyrinomonadaceae bacterium]
MSFRRCFDPPESRELLRQLRYRHKLVKLRTMEANTLHALTINCRLSLRAQLLTRAGRKQLAGAAAFTHRQQQRDEMPSLADELSRRGGYGRAVVERAGWQR